MAGYTALTRIGLPQHEDREVHKGVVVPVPTGVSTMKEPGDPISVKELRAHGQDDDAIKALVKAGAMEAAS